MVRVKVTEKPGVWPYVLVNNFENPPYFAYEVENDDGSKRFVPVLSGGPEVESQPSPPLNLTAKRKAKITLFLKTALKNPLQLGRYMSKAWIRELVTFLGLFDEQTIDATSSTVEQWLRNACFRKLIVEIEERCQCGAAAKSCEEGSPTTTSSSSEDMSE